MPRGDRVNHPPSRAHGLARFDLCPVLGRGPIVGSQRATQLKDRRYTRLTNAFSKKLENHVAMVALYTVWYNFVRINSAVRMAPAMAAGISDRLWDMADIVKLIDEAAPKPGRRGLYKKGMQSDEPFR